MPVDFPTMILMRRSWDAEYTVEPHADLERVDWGDIVENSKAFHALKPVVQAHLKNAVEGVFKREVSL